jgi:hypothetical protein
MRLAHPIVARYLEATLDADRASNVGRRWLALAVLCVPPVVVDLAAKVGPMSPYMTEVEALTKRYGKTQASAGVDFPVPPGRDGRHPSPLGKLQPVRGDHRVADAAPRAGRYGMAGLHPGGRRTVCRLAVPATQH